MTKRKSIDPSEWIECGHVAVRTRSIIVAAHVAAAVKRTRQVGYRLVRIEGTGIRKVDFMDLGIFRERLEKQQRAAS